MPFGEVMYRCNAHYCFSSVFRNRVVGLVVTLALMQLFLFSFYLNGLHSQVVVTTNTGSSSNSPVSSSEQQDGHYQPLELAAVVQQAVGPRHADNPTVVVAGAGSAATVVGADSNLGQRSAPVGQEVDRPDEEFLNPSISKAKAAMGDVAKKALDHLMTNKKPAMDLMAMAAKKLSADPNDPTMAKLGLNLLANAFNNMKNQRGPAQLKPQQQQQQPTNEVTGRQQQAVANSNEPASSSAVNDVEDQSKSQYANLAQMGLQMLTNGLADPSSIAANKGSSPDMRMLEMASQLMWQSAKLSKAGFDPQMAKSALGLLKGAVASQKLDPKLILGLATKMMTMQQQLQQQQQPSSVSGETNGGGFNLLSQLLSNGQLASALLNAGAAAAQPAVSADQSNAIYRNYVKVTSRKLPTLKSKMSSPYSIPSGKVVVDIGFQFTMEAVDTCRSNATYLIMAISSAAHTEERQAARDTWIKDLHQLVGGKVDVVFIIGQTANVTLHRAIEEEATTHRDLIQTNVQEPIENGVFKTLAGLVWIDRHCPEIEQILKIDDDVYVSAATMLKAMEKGKARPTITGSLIDSMNPHTTSDERHKTTKKAWPLKEFPRFVLGGAYLMGRPAVPRLLAAAQVTPVLPLEDVYVTGLCAVGGKVELIPKKSLFEEEISEELETCTFEDFASWRSTGAADVKQTWNFAQAMKRSGEICITTNKCARTFMGICIPSSS
ncbi:uncharacterized protein LOC123471529 [Daphnia magna]|uniref:Lactosylceramide n=1 Tax=Daphnia magna TaxID=35525 RepID=A0ABQ9ZA29_9CRUS|nr:uncharacterized protein LOC123471529 [Daphnia magna]KAK4009741.1 hypothetical protein OUZ56_018887 [Daphnia magna]